MTKIRSSDGSLIDDRRKTGQFGPPAPDPYKVTPEKLALNLVRSTAAGAVRVRKPRPLRSS